ncbi:hypothetical protein PRZ48_005697 [Zasmidium cellare]|uniref:Uncharacterized protein n=1 Tax=Zasmidium cellare TaxID=395010 RepID=A0ABR0ELA9_ZASCE|nr:hypothetical protein PRZ48_005697 [Zasmidium cellare]
MNKRKADTSLDMPMQREPKQRTIYGPFKRLPKPPNNGRGTDISGRRAKQVEQPVIIDLTSPDRSNVAANQEDEVGASLSSARQPSSGIRPNDNCNSAPAHCLPTRRRSLGDRARGHAQDFDNGHQRPLPSEATSNSEPRTFIRRGAMFNTAIEQQLPRATLPPGAQDHKAALEISKDRPERHQITRHYADLSTGETPVYVPVTENEARKLVDLSPKKQGFVDLVDTQDTKGVAHTQGEEGNAPLVGPAESTNHRQFSTITSLLDSLRSNPPFLQLRQNVRGGLQTPEAALENPQLAPLSQMYPEEIIRLLTEDDEDGVPERVD